MKDHPTHPRRATSLLIGLVVILCTGALFAPAAIAKPPDNPGSIAPHGQPYGKSYGDWGAAWWSWAASFPAGADPISAPGGQVVVGDADDQPNGPVWFLAGTFSGSVDRSLTVPSDKALFFPLVNYVYWSPEDCSYLELPRCRATDLRHRLIEEQDQTTNLEVSIEKVGPGPSNEVTYEMLDRYSAISKTFTLEIPPGSVFTGFRLRCRSALPERVGRALDAPGTPCAGQLHDPLGGSTRRYQRGCSAAGRHLSPHRDLDQNTPFASVCSSCSGGFAPTVPGRVL